MISLWPESIFLFLFRPWHRLSASTLGAEDHVLRHLGQQALYPDPVAPLHIIVHGTFSVQVLGSATTTPYRCHLSSETIQGALNAAVAKTDHPLDDRDKDCRWVVHCGGSGEAGEIYRYGIPVAYSPCRAGHDYRDGQGRNRRLTLHQHLETFLHYVQSLYRRLQWGLEAKDCDQRLSCDGKAYAGWFWSSFPERDEELRRAFFTTGETATT